MYGRHFHDHEGRRFARGEFGHGGRHGGREFHPSRGGRGRVFDHGDLRFVVMRLIAEKPRYGY